MRGWPSGRGESGLGALATRARFVVLLSGVARPYLSGPCEMGETVGRASGLVPGSERVGVVAALAGLRPSLEGSWVVVCGCIASGLLHWSDLNALRVVTAWLVGDATVGCVFAQLVALKQLTGRIGGANQASGATGPAYAIPYAAPGSPGDQFGRRIGDHVARWHEHIWPRVGPHVLSALVASGMALLVATYLGREALGVVSAALVLAACLSLAAGRDDALLARWLAAGHLALAWILGHLALAPFHSLSLGLPLLVGLAAYSEVGLKQQRSGAARRLRGIIWAIMVLVVLVARQPILAMVVAVAALAEGMAGGERLEGGTLWCESLPGRLSWLAATLIVALVAIRR